MISLNFEKKIPIGIFFVMPYGYSAYALTNTACSIESNFQEGERKKEKDLQGRQVLFIYSFREVSLLL